MAEIRHVGFPDGQFLANGIDEENSNQLASCWKNGNHEQAKEIISHLPPKQQEVATNIYERCTSITPPSSNS